MAEHEDRHDEEADAACPFFAGGYRRRVEVGSAALRMKTFLEVFRNSFAWISPVLMECQPKLTYKVPPEGAWRTAQGPIVTADVSDMLNQFPVNHRGLFGIAQTGVSLRAAICIGLEGPALVVSYGH